MTPRRHRNGNGHSSGYAVAYRRVSTDEQTASGLGLDAQAASIAQAAERHGVQLRATFTDAGLSGALPIEKRPQLAAALAALRRGDVLIVAKRDRIARDVLTAAMIEAAAKRKGARIVSAAGEGTEADADDPTGQLMRNLIDAFSAYERLVIAGRTASALAALRARGERFSRHAPYGYRFTDDGRLEPEATEQTILAVMRECRQADFSFDGTARELNRLGHHRRNGQPWTWKAIQRAIARNDHHEQATREARA